jgi:PncC family amidohydrolase
VDNDFLNSLTKHNLTLAACESLTGGLFATRITQIPKVGQVFKDGLIVYSNEAKIKLTQVSPTTLEKYGAISPECAEEMARNTQKILGVDLALSFTGNAGPSALEDKPVGSVFIGLVFKEKMISKEYQLVGSREEIREKVVEEGMKLIREILDNK